MNKVIEKLRQIGVIPLAVFKDEKQAVPVANALSKARIDTLEVTLRTEKGVKAIEEIKKNCPGFLAGAGTVKAVQQAKEVKEAGADYIVTPAYDETIANWCKENDMPLLPGVTTPYEIQKAVSNGFTTLKFFPAENYGGAKTLKALAGPFPEVSFMPTGGINTENMGNYLANSNVSMVGGGWICSQALLEKADYEGITNKAKEALQKFLGYEVVHVGINTADTAEGESVAESIGNVFKMPVYKGELSNFVGTGFEVNNFKGLGKYGHVAIDTNRIESAEYYLKKDNIEMNEESRVMVDGKTKVVYLKDEFAGYAIHLRQR